MIDNFDAYSYAMSTFGGGYGNQERATFLHHAREAVGSIQVTTGLVQNAFEDLAGSLWPTPNTPNTVPWVCFIGYSIAVVRRWYTCGVQWGHGQGIILRACTAPAFGHSNVTQKRHRGEGQQAVNKL